MATIHDLPLELIDLILSNFSRPDLALRTCSLLSKSWRTAALPHLFATLRPTLKGGELSPLDYMTFLENLPHIAACVRHLWLRNWPEIDVSLTHAFLSRLPALERLSLELTMFVSASESDRRYPRDQPLNTSCFPPYKLRTMIINHCDIRDDLSDLLVILSLFEIETLKGMFVRPAVTCAHHVDDIASLRQCIRIRDLRLGAHKRLHEPSPTGLLKLLRVGMVPDYLRSMEFTCDSWEILGRAGFLIRDVGRNVTTFKLNLLGLILLERVDALAGRWAELQLASCTRLETFYIHTPYPYHLLGSTPGSASGMSALTAYADILRLLPPSVRTIRLRLPGDVKLVFSQRESAADTAAIERAVLADKRRRFPELEAVELEFDMLHSAECAAFAAKLMPRLHNSGLLRFVGL